MVGFSDIGTPLSARRWIAGQATDAKLAVLADLLADLPSPQRREAIASLPAADRVAVANHIATEATE